MGQDRRSGRRGRCARSRTRAAARRSRRRAGRRLPAALPDRAGTRPGGGPGRDRRPRPGPEGADRHLGCDGRGRRGERVSLAPHRLPARVRPRGAVRRCRRRLPGQRLAVRAVLPGGARGDPDGRAAGRRAAPARLAHGSGGRVPRRAIRGRPDRGAGGDPPDAAQPRLPRLGAAGPSPRARAAPGRRGPPRRTPMGSTSSRRGSSAPSCRTRSRRPSPPRRSRRRSGWASTGCSGRRATGSSAS